jgi:hypothetical protein
MEASGAFAMEKSEGERRMVEKPGKLDPGRRENYLFSMNAIRVASLSMVAGMVCLISGCAWWYETPARSQSAWGGGAAYSITLHCEPEEVVKAHEQDQHSAWLAENPASAEPSAAAWYADVLPGTGGDESLVDDECDSLLNIMREGSDDLLSDARYERAGRRL